VDGQRPVTVPAQHRVQRCQEHVARQQGDGQLPRHDLAHGQAEEGRENVEPVGGRIEELPDR
jgi:hypothetical protein